MRGYSLCHNTTVLCNATVLCSQDRIFPELPADCRARSSSSCNSVRNFLEGETPGARSEDADGQHDHQHARRDECENTFGAEVLKKKRDHEAREYCREAAPGINKSDRASADASGKKFGLIGMQRKKQQIIGERNEHS